MSETFAQFEKRLASLERKHKELAAGYVAKINPDGLITVAPKQQSKGLIVRVLAAALLGVVAFKVFTLSIVGPIVYQGRVDALMSGTSFERATGWILQADPLSQRLATMLSGFIG
jgi:hypothetical protein